MYKEAVALRHNTAKDPSQPLPFSMQSKLLILHGEEILLLHCKLYS